MRNSSVLFGCSVFGVRLHAIRAAVIYRFPSAQPPSPFLPLPPSALDEVYSSTESTADDAVVHDEDFVLDPVDGDGDESAPELLVADALDAACAASCSVRVCMEAVTLVIAVVMATFADS